MKTSYLDYYKLILSKVGFDRCLWEKEYRKALKHLDRFQADELRKWVGQYNGLGPTVHGRGTSKQQHLGRSLGYRIDKMEK